MGYKTLGLRKHPLYSKWRLMRRRCYEQSNDSYESYGGRGISVCDEWRVDFKSYYDYVILLKNAMLPGYTIDRIDNQGDYEPGNVRWASKHEQVVNRGIAKNNTSGYKGVYWDNKRRRWRSLIINNYKKTRIGDFKDLKDAVNARNRYIIQNKLTEYPLQKFNQI